MYIISIHGHIPESVYHGNSACCQRKIRQNAIIIIYFSQLKQCSSCPLPVSSRNNYIKMQLHQTFIPYIWSIFLRLFQIPVNSLNNSFCCRKCWCFPDFLFWKNFEIFSTMLKSIQTARTGKNPAHLIPKSFIISLFYQFIQFFFSEKFIIPVFHAFPPTQFDTFYLFL